MRKLIVCHCERSEAIFLNQKRLLQSLRSFAMTLILTIIPIIAHADINDGLVGQWTFDEGSGTTGVDSSTNGPTWTTGKVGSGALSFDGVDDYVTIPDSASISSIEGSNQATIAFWVKKNTTATMSMVGRYSSTSGRLFDIESDAFFPIRPQWRYGNSGSGGSTLDDTNCSNAKCPMAVGTWHHIVAIYNNPTSSIYYDGTLIGSKNGTGGVLNTGVAAPLLIGQGTGYLNGALDDLRIYNRALTALEVSELYALGGVTTSPSSDTKPDTTPLVIPTNITYWYIDNSVAASGDGRSWATAWKSFSNISWNNIKPGDTLYISGGQDGTERIYQENFVIRKSGEAGKPITFAIDATNNQHNGRAVFDFNHMGESASVTAILLAASNLVFDGNVAGKSHFEIRNLFNTTSRSSGVGFNGNAVQNVIFRYLTFTNINFPIRLTTSSNIEVHHSYFRGVRGDAAILITEPIEGWDVNRVHDNDIEILYNNGGPDGIQGGGSLSIYRNKFRVSKTDLYTSTQHTDTLQVAGNYLKIYDNEFINVGDSVVSPGSWGDNEHRHDIWVFNNIFRIEEALDPYPQYFRIYNNVGKIISYDRVKILNNTFVDNNWNTIYVGNGQLVQPTGSGNEIKNNIFYNLGDTATKAAWWIVPSSGYDANSWTTGNNIYSRPSGVSYVSFLGKSYKATDWIGTFEPTASVNKPTFVRYVENGLDNDFHLLAADTAAQGQGANLTNLCIQVSELCRDKDGNNRPSSGSWDIGSYEYASGGSGDVSDDGKITMYDAALVLRFTLGSSLSDTQQQKADINGDSRVDGADVVAIARKALGL